MCNSLSRFTAIGVLLIASVAGALASQGPGVGIGDAPIWAQVSAKLLVGLLAAIVAFGAIKFIVRGFGGASHRPPR